MLVKVFSIQREFSVFEKSWSKRLLHLEQEISTTAPDRLKRGCDLSR